MFKHDIFIYPDGTLHTIYRDDLDLGEIGAVHIERASHVEFNNETQAWEVTTANGRKLPVSFKRREDALLYEIEYVRACLARGEDP